MPSYPKTRLRRPRQSEFSRRLVRESHLSTDDLIWTMIVSDSVKGREKVESLPGVERVDIDNLVKDAKRAEALGIPAIALFPHISPSLKDAIGTEALNPAFS